MLTTNFKNLAALLLGARNTSGVGLLPVKATNGTAYYAVGAFSASGTFPYSVTTGLNNNMTGAGIGFGSGSLAESESDYTLQTPITSGLSATVTVGSGMDGASPYLRYDLVVSNTTDADITIAEICYKQNIYASTAQGAATSNASRVCMLDRTVLPEAVTIPAGGAATIRYTLKTLIGS